MQFRQVLKTALPGLAVVLAGGLFVAGYFASEAAAARERALKTFIKTEVKPRLQDKAQDIGRVLKTIHENARLVAELPGVRELRGNNRADITEEVNADQRMNPHDFGTLKRIYDNLTGNVQVSELYITRRGFDDQSGEVPLIMFDSAITGEDRERHARSEEMLDIPEENESYEYAHIAESLRQLEHSYPRDDFRSVDSIPFAVSEPMRTCDNSQYRSIRHGNIRDTTGLVLSTPFYSAERGELAGLVSILIRLNALEAILIGAPMVIVTDEDREVARMRQWVEPPLSPLVLQDSGRKITVFDRRNPTVVADVRHGDIGVNVFSTNIRVPGNVDWTLSYFISRAELEHLDAEVAQTYRLPFFATGALSMAAAAAVLLFAYLRLSNQRLNTMLASVREAEQRTQERSQELIALQQKLVSSEKRAALGIFTAGIAHEINNPANFASVGAQNAEVQVNELRTFIADLLHNDQDSEIREAFGGRFRKIDMSLNAVRSGLTRIERVVKSLQAGNPEGNNVREPCAIIDLLETAAQIVIPSIQAPVTLRKQLFARPVFAGNVADLNQVFLALLTNAGHAIEDAVQQRGSSITGEITLESWEENGMLGIAIADNGLGIAIPIRDRIFDPFFTTKPVGRGSGLGLSTARSTVQAHGGTLVLDTARGQGTRFVVRLPLSPTPDLPD